MKDQKKKLLSGDELIQHLDRKGITFNHISREAAREFLGEHNYFFKIYAYRANYRRIDSGPREGQYTGLDFSYLQELSTIDCLLRYLIIEMCLSLEHALKVMLIHDIESNPDEDGYNITKRWNIANSSKGMSRLQKAIAQAEAGYCKELVHKSYSFGYPIWVVCEIISFGDLCRLIKIYSDMYPKRIPFNPLLLHDVKTLRNAAAHNTCIINNLRPDKDFQKYVHNTEVYRSVAKISAISQQTRLRCLSNQRIYDLTTLLYLFFRVVKSRPIKEKTYRALIRLFVKRMPARKAYFRDNAMLRNIYRFMIYVIRQNYYGNI